MITKIKSFTNTEDKKRLFSNFMSLSVLQAFTYILPLLTLPYLVRVLGAEKFGLVMFAQAFIMFFVILTDYGFNLSATREVSIHREDKSKLTEIFSAVMMIKAFLILVSFIVLSVIVFGFERFSGDWKLYYLTFLFVLGQVMFPIWYFQGMERMKYITIVNVMGRLIFTILIFIVVQNEADYIYVPVLNGLGMISGGVFSLWIIHHSFKQPFKMQNMITLRKHFMESSHFFLSRVSVSIYTSANAFVLGLLTNNTMVGYYSIAEKLYQALQSFYSPITQALYPYVAKEKNIPLFKKILTISVAVNTLGIVLLYFIGSYIFDFLFTEQIGAESLQVFHILLIAALIVVPSIMIGYPFLGALGFAKYANSSVIYGSMLHICGLALLGLTENITIYSVAYMVLITEMFVFSNRVNWVRRKDLWAKR
ncbi:MAG: oligosaccharide flippase family protein [Sulfurovum sp.]|nr:oligosaccharide flippase family protein [Sulfurovum sp.]